MATKRSTWPTLVFEEYKNTQYLLHHWFQMVGKVRLKKSPWQNHSWHVTLYVDSQGLTTGPIPYESGNFEIRFDFTRHEVKFKTSNGTRDRFSLGGQTIASFYEQINEKLKFLGIPVKISDTPNEMIDCVPFAKNTKRIPYLPNEAQKLWKALVLIQNAFTVFRARYRGKHSPVHFFWGSFDLAYSRFSGEEAPEYESSQPNISKEVMKEAYSHEVFSIGFWPGGEAYPDPCFYAYCYPYPEGFQESKISPETASWNSTLGEFILPFKSVQSSSNPQVTLLAFIQSTYEAAAGAANWDRAKLDCDFSDLEKKNSNITL